MVFPDLGEGFVEFFFKLHSSKDITGAAAVMQHSLLLLPLVAQPLPMHEGDGAGA